MFKLCAGLPTQLGSWIELYRVTSVNLHAPSLSFSFCLFLWSGSGKLFRRDELVASASRLLRTVGPHLWSLSINYWAAKLWRREVHCSIYSDKRTCTCTCTIMYNQAQCFLTYISFQWLSKAFLKPVMDVESTTCCGRQFQSLTTRSLKKNLLTSSLDRCLQTFILCARKPCS